MNEQNEVYTYNEILLNNNKQKQKTKTTDTKMGF